MQPYPWQQVIWQRLMTARRDDRLPHALIFSGAEGLGKRALAETLASSLLCNAPAADGVPCGRCKGCLLRKAGTHPDFRSIAPEEAGKEILVGSIRAYIEKAGLSNQLGGYKVLLIEPAEAMNVAAANSLLKTLEEPAESTLMILVTAHPARLQATIRSRCQMVLFTRPGRAEGLAWWRDQGVSGDAELLLGLADGAPLRALALDQPEILQERKAALEEFCALLEGRGDALAAAELWEKRDLQRLFLWMSGWVIDMLRLFGGGEVQLANVDQQERFRRLAERLDARALFTLLDKVYEGRRGLRGSLNTRLLVEDLLLSVTQCARVSSGGN